MKKNYYLYLLAASIAICACTEDEPQKSVIKTSPSASKYDIMPEELPSPLEQERYTPSQKNTFYRPIMVDYSSQNAPVTSWISAKTRVLSYVVDYTRAIDKHKDYVASVNRYGSSVTKPKQEATGRFYTKKIDGRWWIVDPEGYLHYERSVTSMRKGSSARNAAAWNERFGSDAEWMSKTQSELAEIGFHGTGAFCTGTYATIQQHNTDNAMSPMTLAPSFGFLSQFRSAASAGADPGGASTNMCMIIFNPAATKTWEQFCRDYMETALLPYKGDKNVLGFFSDNEIAFSSSGSHLLQRLLDMNSPGHYAYEYAKAFMTEKGAGSVTESLASEFAGRVAEKYYKGVREALDVFDPGMMYLGTRLHGQPKYVEGIVKAAGNYCDIVSINYYGRWSVELDTRVADWASWTDTPFLVTEFYTKGIDDSDLNNKSGAGLSVRNQAARAYAYQHFTLGLLEAKNCVGWHWFKYQDDDGADNSGEPANKGVYDNYYVMFPKLAKFMRDVNYNVYSLTEYFDSK